MKNHHPISRPLLALLLLASTARAQSVLTSGDAEVSVSFIGSLVGTTTNPFLITMRDGPALREYAGVRAGFGDPERVYLRADDSSSIEIPDDPLYGFLGAPGQTVWILPEATDEDLLTPGVSTENRTAEAGWQGVGVSSQFLVRGIPGASTFLNNRITLTLASFTGPGDFYLYRTDGFGNPLISFRTDDGLDATDARTFSAGSHTHFNWVFTAPGDYYLGFRASGTLSSGSQFVESDVTGFHFQIVPEPSTAALLGLATLGVFLRRRRAARRSRG